MSLTKFARSLSISVTNLGKLPVPLKNQTVPRDVTPYKQLIKDLNKKIMIKVKKKKSWKFFFFFNFKEVKNFLNNKEPNEDSQNFSV